MLWLNAEILAIKLYQQTQPHKLSRRALLDHLDLGVGSLSCVLKAMTTIQRPTEKIINGDWVTLV